MGSKAGISPTAMLAVHSGKGYYNLFSFFSHLTYAPRESSFNQGVEPYFEGTYAPLQFDS